MAENSHKRKLPSWMKGRGSDCKEAGSKKALLNLPLLTFDGSLVYSYNKDDCALICQDILESLDENKEQVVGFDMEWPVTYEVGKEPKTAVIQLCLPSATDKCFIFHVSCMPDLPKPLKDLLLDHRLKKCGIGIESDFWKLGRDFDLSAKLMIEKSMINLTQVANDVLGSKENWSLDGLCRHVLSKSLKKDPTIRKGDWSQYPLSDVQKTYAAVDAYAGLLLYRKLMLHKRKDSS